MSEEVRECWKEKPEVVKVRETRYLPTTVRLTVVSPRFGMFAREMQVESVPSRLDAFRIEEKHLIMRAAGALVEELSNWPPAPQEERKPGELVVLEEMERALWEARHSQKKGGET